MLIRGTTVQGNVLYAICTYKCQRTILKLGGTMKITDFSIIVAEMEKGKKEISIGQIKEVLKIVNQLLDGQLYKFIKSIKEKGV